MARRAVGWPTSGPALANFRRQISAADSTATTDAQSNWILRETYFSSWGI